MVKKAKTTKKAKRLVTISDILAKDNIVHLISEFRDEHQATTDRLIMIFIDRDGTLHVRDSAEEFYSLVGILTTAVHVIQSDDNEEE